MNETRDRLHPNAIVRSPLFPEPVRVAPTPFQEKDQVITSVSWVSRIEDANDSLLRSEWDLVIVDEAHKMSAYRSGPDGKENKTLAYQLGEALSSRTDHYLLMTATPHKGDPDNFILFLRLLDEDVCGDITSLQEAMRRQEAPFYLRWVKEALVTFPDPDGGEVKTLFTRRDVRTIDFEIDADEWDFYNALTRFVEEQSIVIWQFIAPYSSYADDLASMQKLVMIAAIAWNAAIMAEEGSAGFLDRMIETLPADAREEGEAVIEELIRRKKRYFADNKRMIVNIKVTDTGDGFHLAVAASMPGQDV